MEDLMLEILEELKIELNVVREQDIKMLESKVNSAKREVQKEEGTRNIIPWK